ncbi:hypothetical protein A3D77_01730 [Candidatus Gottesmanbacteria bacterium RIFCSPHIGHO2_02_FULL_39_11]|uniref:Uncharacterized protein n=1 Tax=Candidatus Gottesmanbacteria bacterium RIFCSPHIGHO2_02_FULL_39_11 TaxID=1798382 RepID=A0A1F5ZTR8_9BACT|nr:MAG: hypothetical protein A3D77_01730 [Candidatus Gottesmanbacteria bacterium RIFCSPHIGHO2_02_FULL_39_11]
MERSQIQKCQSHDKISNAGGKKYFLLKKDLFKKGQDSVQTEWQTRPLNRYFLKSLPNLCVSEVTSGLF